MDDLEPRRLRRRLRGSAIGLASEEDGGTRALYPAEKMATGNHPFNSFFNSLRNCRCA